jgi:CRP/FNR family transcriptional regulator, cyclic AMP receptor protein
MSFSLFSSSVESSRYELLHPLPLLGDLSRRELGVISALMHDRNYLKGEIIFDEGDDGQALYVILSGRVAIVRENDPRTPLGILEPGQFFGELALLDDSPRMAQARAEENCVLAVLFRGEFAGLMQSHAVIASKISFRLAQELGVRLRRAMAAWGKGDPL